MLYQQCLVHVIWIFWHEYAHAQQYFQKFFVSNINSNTSQWSSQIRRVSYGVLRIVSDGVGHVDLGWSEIMGGCNAPDTVVKLNPKYSDINYESIFPTHVQPTKLSCIF